MPLILVTGLPGTGKTSVRDELRARGYPAVDGDGDGLLRWVDEDGNETERTDRYSAQWLQTHTQVFPRLVALRLAEQAGDQFLFVCANPLNEDEVLDLFVFVFALELDEPDRQYRLTNRTNHTWGKLPHEVAYDLAMRDMVLLRHRRAGHTIIDVSLPLSQVVDSMLDTLVRRGIAVEPSSA